MKTNKKNRGHQEFQSYVPMNMEVMFLAAQSIICTSDETSGDVESFNVRGEDGLNWLED